jgi:hypothetical protein
LNGARDEEGKLWDRTRRPEANILWTRYLGWTHEAAMGLLGRLRGDDEDEREPKVRSLHAAMKKAAEAPSPEANAVVFGLLAQAELWALVVGPWPDRENLMKQARLSGPLGDIHLNFRGGHTRDGEDFFPTATTRKRLLRSGLGQPGDSMVHLPFRFLAAGARYGGADTLVVNPGTVPIAVLARAAVFTFADGLIPDVSVPDGKATAKRDHLAPLEPIEADTLPAGLLDVATTSVRAEPAIAAASLVVRSVGEARLFMILAVVVGELDRMKLTDRLMARIIGTIGGDNYAAVEFVAPTDPRLTDPGRGAVLIAG